MTARAFKAIALFLWLGVFSGLLTAALVSYSGVLLWTIAGLIFGLAVGVSLLIARVKGWLSLNLSKRQIGLFASITTIGYPLSIGVMIAVTRSYSAFYRLLFLDSWQRRINTGEGIAIGAEAAKLGVYSAAVTGAIIVSFALRIVSGSWDRKVSVFLILAALGAVFLSDHLPSQSEHYIESIQVLFIVGQALFASLCASWLLRVNERINGRSKQSLEV